MPPHHELPTHLAVEDRPILGLSMRQVLFLVCGACGAYALWLQLGWLPPHPRLLLAACNLAVSVAGTLCRPGGRGLEEWALVLLRYRLTPRLAVWRPAVAPLPPEPAERWCDFGQALPWLTGPAHGKDHPS